MFDQPNIKCVRRDDILSSSSSREPSPVNEADVKDGYARLGKLLDLDSSIIAHTSNASAQGLSFTASGVNEEEEQEFEFRLFSTSGKPKGTTDSAQRESNAEQSISNIPDIKEKDSTGTQKLRIRLRSPTPDLSDPTKGRFVKAFRGWQYYVSTPSLLGLTEGQAETNRQLERRHQFEDIAVTGGFIKTLTNLQPWHGCNLPWRVIHLKRHQTKLPPKSKDVPVYVVEGALPVKSPKTRKKPGKKRRIQLRKKSAAIEAAKEGESEKRTRKNRERKIKRRQKAREEKAAAAAAAAAVVDTQ